ncbi:MAG: exodeoxyribonuclease VII large subunit [Paludibacter sp.]|nr:exodeoxyribonuclease VII large subunit [Paludibacter sp.]
MKSLSLSELLNAVRQVIKLNFEEPLWVRAEIGELHENNRHAYFELVENAEDSNKILAKIRAICWESTYKMLKPYFEETTGQILREGISLRIQVTVDFHEVYGISLNIKDIDPAFTVGDMAIRRLQIVRKLQEEGIADMNKMLQLPQCVQRIAIISSSTAAGYGDFIHQIQTNERGYKLYKVLFQSVMQGDAAANSIISSLEKIYANLELFDAVIIIRGGGAATDLACFDSYNLALNIAQFPLPIVVGIGHQRDNTIVDLVANQSLKTPTAVAEFLINQMQNTENKLYKNTKTIVDFSENEILSQNNILEQIHWKISHLLKSVTSNSINELNNKQFRFKNAARNIIISQRNKLDLFEKIVRTHSPQYLLKKGFSITTLNGQRLFSVKSLKKDDKIKTFLNDGAVESVIIES